MTVEDSSAQCLALLTGRVTRIYFCVVAAIVLAGVPLSAQLRPISVPEQRLRSNSEETRMRAFYELLDSASKGVPKFQGLGPRVESLARQAKAQDQIATTLIDLLELENQVERSGTRALSGEGQIAYYGDLIGAVAALRDARAQAALLGALGTGDLAVEGLVSLGERALAEIVRATRDLDEDRRWGALRALEKLAARRVDLAISARGIEVVRATLVASLSDSTWGCRVFAILGLAHFDGPDIRTRMQDLAANDSGVRTFEDGSRDFPVRRAARDWILAHPG